MEPGPRSPSAIDACARFLRRTLVKPFYQFFSFGLGFYLGSRTHEELG
jgi:hypothetical protein